MGFGSYDESEQERQELDADDIATDVSERSDESEHDGDLDFEIGASNEQLLERLKEIKTEEDTEE